MIESPSLPPPLAMPDRSFGRVARSVIGYGLVIGLMSLTIVVFVPAALIHSALRNGRGATWVSLLIAAALGAAYYAGVPATTPEIAKMAWSSYLTVIFAVALPTMAALPLVQRSESFGRVLVFLLIVAGAGLVLAEVASHQLMAYSPFAGQVAQWKKGTADAVNVYRANGVPVAASFQERFASLGATVLPAIMLIGLAVMFIFSLLMIGRLKTWRDHVERRGDADAAAPVYLFRYLQFPEWLLFGFILGGLTPLTTGLVQTIAANVLTVIVFLYMLQGLAIFRYMLVAVGAGFAATLLGWTLLGFMSLTGMGLLLLGLAGLFDPFFDFRHFKNRKDDSHESHSD